MTEYVTLSDAAAAVRAGVITSVELVQAAIDAADRWEPALGAYITRFDEQSLAAAQEADRMRQTGQPVGPLHGVPIGIKDIITTREGPTTAQSVVHDTAALSGDAVVVARLRAAGAIITGKTTTMEFASGLPDPSKPFPIPRNPWNLDTWPGGSSSGTASGVAAGLFLGGLGTDTAGSIRIPSAFCGITGLMPTFGRVPKSGCVPFGFTLDHIGPMAPSARDCAVMLGVLAGPDPSDPHSIDAAVPDYTAQLTGDLTGLTVGVDRLARVSGTGADPALSGVLDDAISMLEQLGAHVVDVTVPLYDEVTAAVVVIGTSELLAYHLPDAQARLADYAAANRTMLAGGVLYSGADYVQAQRVRRVGQLRLAELFQQVDLVLTPTNSVGAIPYSEFGPDFMTRWFPYMHTAYWDAPGNPVASVPAGLTAGGLPLGFQLAGRPFEEATVLRATDAFQRVTDHHLQRPARRVGLEPV